MVSAWLSKCMALCTVRQCLRLAHRIIVLRQGRVVGEMTGDMASEEAIVRLSTGAKSETSASGTVEVARAS